MGQRENEEIINYLNSRKYFISSSLYEGNPKGVLEAMSQVVLFLFQKTKTHLKLLTMVKTVFYIIEKGVKKLFV